MRANHYADIEALRRKAGEVYVQQAHLFTLWEKIRQAYDECIGLDRSTGLSAEDVARCNFCAELLKKRRGFRPNKR
jgi:hypothetical protein